MIILVLNAGSSSLKYKFFDKNLKKLKSGNIERIGQWIKNHERALGLLIKKNKDLINQVSIIGHRVVMGGEKFVEPIEVNRNILKKLQSYNKLAPLHNPANLAVIEACRKLLPKIENIAVFDTAFHQTAPPYVFIYPLPYRFYKKYKIRKYGFHGTSHKYVIKKAEKRYPSAKRIISLHLGAGCSAVAYKNGKVLDTSMGFTPLEGLMMCTRSGSIDPALPLYMINEMKIKPPEVYKLLNEKSGLYGITGKSDMRDVLLGVKKRDNKDCLALAMFVYRAKKCIGAYAAVLGGIDLLIFTGAIGEGSKKIRSLIIKNLGFLGNFKTLVICTDEELQIAKEMLKLNKGLL
jgi:acetate kinase